ncbi:hypothetical protein EDC01DRAFT_640696 [Geopyxis carbonaria]|nr:hypothetical protein EDC01DRAFT_640696 [Geopyxis carbonaria]
MADFLDDELLELAGEGDDDEQEVKPQISSSSPAAAAHSPLASSPKKRSRAPPKRSRKKVRRDADSSEEEGEESDTLSDDEEFSDASRSRRSSSAGSVSEDDSAGRSLYPLEGKYKDQADKERLLAMSELDREAVLGERASTLDQYNFDRQLRIRLKTQKNEDREAGESRRTSKRTKSAPKKSEEATKRGKLDELRRTRENRKAVGGKAQYGDEDVSRKMLDDDDEGDFVDDSHIPEEREITLQDINRARIGRTGLAKLADYPGFGDVIPDVFVRVRLAQQQNSKEPDVYRLCVVKGVTTGKVYEMMGGTRKTNEYLNCFHGKADRQWPMDLLSDKPIQESEFTRWKAQLNSDRLPLPSLSLVMRKAKELRELDNKVLTPAELEAMLTKRTKGNEKSVTLFMERSNLKTKLEHALEINDEEEAERCKLKLQEIEDRVKPRTVARGETQMERMARINAENRRRNMQEIRDSEIAEKRAARERARNGIAGGDHVNPFQRVKTAVKFRHDNNTVEETPEKKATPAPTDKAPANGVGVMNAITLPKGRRMAGVDDIIASMDIEIEL